MRIFKAIAGASVLVVGCAGLALWWAGRPPKRPPNLSAGALFIEKFNVPFKVRETGEWLDSWFDERDRAARCKLTNMNGWLEFEDVFLPYPGQAPLSQADVVVDRRRTGGLWSGTYEKGTNYPIPYLTNGEILLPKSEYEKAQRCVNWTSSTKGSQ